MAKMQLGLGAAALVFGLVNGAACAHALVQSDLEAGIEEDFALMDTDGDERISQSEFAAVLSAQNPGTDVSTAANAMFSQIDADGDGFVTKVEYGLFALRQSGGKGDDCVDCD